MGVKWYVFGSSLNVEKVILDCNSTTCAWLILCRLTKAIMLMLIKKTYTRYKLKTENNTEMTRYTYTVSRN